ncbi:hypothetical protein, partial [Bacillus subtilis]|uniref:hypothetical protein n=1 Tax=Bacillus subtilis TaxID=1423 RepID=UPI001BDB989F
ENVGGIKRLRDGGGYVGYGKGGVMRKEEMGGVGEGNKGEWMIGEEGGMGGGYVLGEGGKGVGMEVRDRCEKGESEL